MKLVFFVNDVVVSPANGQHVYAATRTDVGQIAGMCRESASKALTSFARLPGPGRLFIYWWFFMMLATQAQISAMIGGIAVATIVTVLVIAPAVGAPILNEEQESRLTAFLNPSDDPSGPSYQVNQALIAVGSAAPMVSNSSNK